MPVQETLKSSVIWGGNIKKQSTLLINDTSYQLPETIVTVPPTYNNRYVNAYELFQIQIGRNPYNGERIRFIIPNSISLIGAPQLIGSLNWNLDRSQWINEHISLSHPGFRLLGLESNEVTIDVYGTIIGAPMNTKSIEYMYNTSYTPSNPATDYLVDHLQNLSAFSIGTSQFAAIESSESYNLIVRSTGRVIGHGGVSELATRDYPDNDNGRGSDALSISDDYTSNDIVKDIRVKVEVGGVLIGGGGSGGSAGIPYGSVSGNPVQPLVAGGGGGAPYGGRRFIWSGKTNDPVCPINFYYESLSSSDIASSNRAGWVYYRRPSSSSISTPSSGGNRITSNNLVNRDFQAGSGGLWGENGTRGHTYTYQGFPQEELDAMSPHGLAGSIGGVSPGLLGGTKTANIIYDNSIN